MCHDALSLTENVCAQLMEYDPTVSELSDNMLVNIGNGLIRFTIPKFGRCMLTIENESIKTALDSMDLELRWDIHGFACFNVDRAELVQVAEKIAQTEL